MLQRTFSIRRTKEVFSKVIWFYDYWERLTEKKRLWEAIKIAGIYNGLNILDVVGTGQLFENVLRVNKAGFNIGIDVVLVYSQ